MARYTANSLLFFHGRLCMIMTLWSNTFHSVAEPAGNWRYCGTCTSVRPSAISCTTWLPCPVCNHWEGDGGIQWLITTSSDNPSLPCLVVFIFFKWSERGIIRQPGIEYWMKLQAFLVSRQFARIYYYITIIQGKTITYRFRQTNQLNKYLLIMKLV